jgi:hypothetical protein
MGQPQAISSFEQALETVKLADDRLSEKATAAKIFPALASIPLSLGTAVIKDKVSLNVFLFQNSPYRYNWLCAGIGTGKSHQLARYALRRVVENWETVGLIAANTVQQLSQSTLPHLFELLDESGLKYRVNSRPPKSWGSRNLFRFGYKNVISILVGKGKVAHILVRTLTGWKRIRGVTIGWACIDEVADTVVDAWNEIKERLRCSLSHRLQIMVAGMPAMPGDNWTWEVFNPKDPDAKKMFKVIFQSSTEAAHLSWDEYLLPLLRTLDPVLALQRIFARIVINQMGRVYYAYRDQVNNILKYPYDPKKPIIMCWDFNIFSSSPISLVLCQEHWNAEKQHWEVQTFDEIVITGATTIDACLEFIARYGTRHQAEVLVFGDATSNLNRTVPEFQHIVDTLYPRFGKRLVIPDQPKTNPEIILRVESFNAMLGNALGDPRFFACPTRCPELILDFRKMTGKDGKLDKTDKARSHCSDGVGYFLWLRHRPILHQQKSKQTKANY